MPTLDGVGLVARPGVQMTKVHPQCPVERDLYCTARYVHGVVVYGDRKQVSHVMNLYGYNGAVGDTDTMRSNEDFLRSVFEMAAGLGNVPVFVVGYFNVPMEASMALATAAASGRWFDVAAVCAHALGLEPAPTCFVRDTSAGSRIDAIWCNNGAIAAIRCGRVLADTGLPTYRPVACKVELDVYSEWVRVVKKPRPIPVDWKDPSPESEPETASRIARPIVQASYYQWAVVQQCGNTEARWLFLSQCRGISAGSGMPLWANIEPQAAPWSWRSQSGVQAKGGSGKSALWRSGKS